MGKVRFCQSEAHPGYYYIPGDLPDNGGKDYVPAAEYEALKQQLEESESERIYYKDRLKPAFDYVNGKAVSIAEDEIDRLERRLAEVEAENKRLREALLHIVGKYDSPTPIGTSEWYELAKAALREGE